MTSRRLPLAPNDRNSHHVVAGGFIPPGDRACAGINPAPTFGEQNPIVGCVTAGGRRGDAQGDGRGRYLSSHESSPSPAWRCSGCWVGRTRRSQGEHGHRSGSSRVSLLPIPDSRILIASSDGTPRSRPIVGVSAFRFSSHLYTQRRRATKDPLGKRYSARLPPMIHSKPEEQP